jgi:hypothetical protein
VGCGADEVEGAALGRGEIGEFVDFDVGVVERIRSRVRAGLAMAVHVAP